MSDKVKESPLKQELGPKKYQQKVEAANKFYDKHKAGKRDPKTGVFYHNISTTDPSKPKLSGTSIGCFKCPNEKCDNGLSIKRSTVSVQCSQCHSSVSVSVDKLTDEVTLTVNSPKPYCPVEE